MAFEGDEMTILKRTERAMVRSMRGVTSVDRKNMEELMEMLGLKKTLDRMAKANGVRWYEHVIRRNDDNVPKAKNDMKEAGRRECEESRVEDRGSCRSNEMEGRCESDCERNEVYPATFGDEEKTG